jgi:transmembrane sensor
MNGKQRIVEGNEDTLAAVRWFHRFLRDNVSTLPADELADWAQWADPQHLKQFHRVKLLWRHLGDVLPGIPRPARAECAEDDYDGSIPISAWKAQRSHRRRGWHLHRSKLFAIAACASGITGGIAAYLHPEYLRSILGDRVQSYATAASQHRVIALADGSSITLGARTELSTHYTASRRIIFLERGEAWFSVAHNPRRPFTVLAGGGAITAIGTQFDVRRELDSSNLDRVTVTVGNGTVEVGPPKETISKDVVEPSDLGARDQPEWTSARLVQGQEITYDTEGPRERIKAVDLEAVEAWKVGRLEYRRMPLKLVIPSVNRYSEKLIVLADGSVGELPFSGTVLEDQVSDWLRALASALPIEVTESRDTIVISARDGAKSY